MVRIVMRLWGMCAEFIATLYDIGRTLHKDNISEWETTFLKTLPGEILSMSSRPALLEEYLKFHGYNRIIGECRRRPDRTFYFRFNGIPTTHFYGNISAEMAAPGDSYLGSKKEGAIPWLYLTNLQGEAKAVSKSLDIYQFYTAGGEPPGSCLSERDTSKVPYTAQYWIYEQVPPSQHS